MIYKLFSKKTTKTPTNLWTSVKMWLNFRFFPMSWSWWGFHWCYSCLKAKAARWANQSPQLSCRENIFPLLAGFQGASRQQMDDAVGRCGRRWKGPDKTNKCKPPGLFSATVFHCNPSTCLMHLHFFLFQAGQGRAAGIL